MEIECEKLFPDLVSLLNNLQTDLSMNVKWNGILTKVYFSLQQGASLNNILMVEKNTELPLPKSFRKFLRCWNGLGLYLNNFKMGYSILSIEDLTVKTNDARLFYGDLWRNGIIFFCYIGDGNYLGFDTNLMNNDFECPIIDCFHEYLPSNWRIIAKSFEEWIRMLIDAQGLPHFWLI
jgi:hypothetical protein